MRQNGCVATADPFAQLRLLDLQEADSHLDQIAHRRANLSEVVRLRDIEQGLLRLRTLIVAGETEVSDRERGVRKMEVDVDQVRMRADKDQQLLDSGSISNPKQLEDLAHEVASLKRRQEALEDDELVMLEELEDRICRAFDRVSWEKDFTLIEGTGHAGVGSVFDLSNARVAKLLNAKVIIVTPGGIGRPIDEIAMNKALFDRFGVEVVGAILDRKSTCLNSSHT